MDGTRVKTLVEEILALPDPDRHQLAEAVLPALLATPRGVAAIDEALQGLSDADLDALVERARSRGPDLTEDGVAAVIGEALRAARTQSSS